LNIQPGLAVVRRSPLVEVVPGRFATMEAGVGEFAVDVIQTDDRAVLRLTGELDVATAPRLREEIDSLTERCVWTVSVDMSSLSFIDSSGMAALVAALKRLRAGGGELTLHSPNLSAMKVLAITGLDKLFPIT
jgi:anti-sigma B factor antagonist